MELSNTIITGIYVKRKGYAFNNASNGVVRDHIGLSRSGLLREVALGGLHV